MGILDERLCVCAIRIRGTQARKLASCTQRSYYQAAVCLPGSRSTTGIREFYSPVIERYLSIAVRALSPSDIKSRASNLYTEPAGKRGSVQ